MNEELILGFKEQIISFILNDVKINAEISSMIEISPPSGDYQIEKSIGK